MEKHLQRFEIVQALSNAVYEARDTANGSTVRIFEWTPPATELDERRNALAGIAETGELKGEVLSAYASLYLVETSPGDAKIDLEPLRKSDLFTGHWEIEPAPPPRDSQYAPPPAPEEGKSGISVGKLIFGILFFSLIAFAAGALTGGSGTVPSSQLDSAQAQLNSARSDLSQMNAKLDEANQRATNLHQQNDQLKGVHLLIMTNSCEQPVQVAVRYLNFNKNWINEGWLGLNTGETSVIAVSPGEDFYVFARSTGNPTYKWTHEDGSLEMNITRSEFAYADNDGPNANDMETVKPLYYKVSGATDHQSFTCASQ